MRAFSLTRRLILAAIIFLTLMLSLGINTSPVSAAAIVVNTTEDIDNSENDGYCTLREAIIAANTDTAYRDCPAGSGADLILLYAGIYTIDSQLPDITTELTIRGTSSANVIIQAAVCDPTQWICAQDWRIFLVSASGNLTLNNLTLRHGQVSGTELGSAIRNDGTLSISNTILTANRGVGGGIYNTGTLVIEDSSFLSNLARTIAGQDKDGGAIYNALGGVVTIQRCTFIDNQALQGGAIRNDGVLEIIDTTFAYNLGVTGAAICILSNQSQMSISNSTFYGNVAQIGGGAIMTDMMSINRILNCTFAENQSVYGGAIWNFGALDINSSTFSGNIADVGGGGIWNDSGTVNLSNTIIAYSTNGDCASNTPIGTNLNNLIEDGSCGATLSEDPNLGPLADNGGYTLTLALLEGSPAIDAGDMISCPATDQRGVDRPQGSGCDIGAYELEQEAPTSDLFIPILLN